ncbi:MAG: hypothetical protein KatS3mg011_1088 [Acidimicrobiia bacterium]|nr:MAG: hypothetical protein KatS3mg011_1088 [Acidimicrobiia bacterium]
MSSSKPSPKRKPTRGRTWRRIVIGVLLAANLAVLFLYWRLKSLEDVIQTTASTVEDVVPSLTPRNSNDVSGEPVTFLLIGSDSRERLDDLTNFGQAGGQRADVIMLVKIYPADDRAQILSIPRDLWVEIPGRGENRINAAYAFGGAALMVDTVKAETGLPVNHYVEVDFLGFKAIVDQLGGVVIDFPYPARDPKSGLDVEAGPQLLDGDQALAYARSRSYQEYRDGRWVSVDASDIGRTRRQQALIFAILRRMARPTTVLEAGSVVEAFASHLVIDSLLAKSSLVELAFSMRGVSPERIETATLPTVPTTIAGASVLLRDEPAATEMLTAFSQGRPLSTIERDQLTVDVFNGNGVEGSAGRWADELRTAGYEIRKVADAERSDYPTTAVIVRPSDMAIGVDVVGVLGFGEVEAGTLDSGVDVVVILGADAETQARN